MALKKSMLEKMSSGSTPAATSEHLTGFQMIPLDKIRFNPKQPRQDFHTLDGQVPAAAMQGLQELADDIKANDLIHPITVKELDDGNFEVVIGERRTRAFLLLKKKAIPAKVRNDLDGTTLDLYQLAENIQREDLNENDLARFIHKIVEGGKVTKKDLAKMFSKPPSWVTRYLSFADPIIQAKWVEPGYVDKAWILYALLQLPQELQDEALEVVKNRVGEPLRSSELKALEGRAKRHQTAQAEAAAQRAVLPAPSERASAGKGKGREAEQPQHASSPLAALLEGADVLDGTGSSGEGDQDAYRPNARELEALRSGTTNAGGGSTEGLSYAGDDADQDFNGHAPVANMHRMPSAATSTVTSRVSLDQLVAIQRALEVSNNGVSSQTRGLAVEFRADEALVRAVLAALGEDAGDLPSSVLTLKLTEVAQRLVKTA